MLRAAPRTPTARVAAALLAAGSVLGSGACERADEPENDGALGAAATSAPLEPAQPGLAPRERFRMQEFSPDAKRETAEMLLADRDTQPHASDGGGRAVLDAIESPAGEPLTTVVGGGFARFRLRFITGPLGIAPGGTIFLQPSPFWRWGAPQFEDATAPGYTTVETQASGVQFEAIGHPDGIGVVTIRGRGLEAGDEVVFVYGAGALGVRVDDYAEREERIWFMVDGNADGFRRLVDDSPTLDIRPSVPGALVATLPTTASPVQPISLRIAVLDVVGNRGVTTPGTLHLTLPEGLIGPESVTLDAADAGVRSVELRASRPGIFRVAVRFETDDADRRFRSAAASEWKDDSSPAPLETRAGPMIVAERTRSILWADFHGHSSLSDGTGTPEDYFAYARDVAALDAVALTDHDHWGMRPLESRPDLWRRIREAVGAAHEPGRFVALLGYEWTSWLHGHRHVLYFESDLGRGQVFSSLDAETDTPAELWEALRGRDALTFAHHSAGGPVSTNWGYPPDPVLEPVTEITSVHGSSESFDTPVPIYSPVPGNFVRDALDAGYPLGLIGSGDSHDGHPGLTHVGSPSQVAGLAAIVGAERTRASVLDALRARSVYATNGPRIWLRATLEGHEMGTRLPASLSEGGPEAPEEIRLQIAVAGTAPLVAIDVVTRGEIGTIELAGELEWSGSVGLPPIEDGAYLYVRVVQSDRGTAWSSPFFCCDPP